MSRPKASSVTEAGRSDGFKPPLAWFRQAFPGGATRLMVSAPPARLPEVHRALVASLAPPLGLLWRQKVDRRDPRPQGAPPRDHVALELPTEQVLEALKECSILAYEDARGELWLRDRYDAQLVLDDDGLIFCYPDDPSFRDALAAQQVPEQQVQTMADRDYVKHWYRPEADAEEAGLIAGLGLQRVS